MHLFRRALGSPPLPRFLLIALALLGIMTAVCGARAPAAAGDEMVNAKLRAAVVEAQSKLGELEPWQKKIFDEEAVPQFQRFILNYRASQPQSGSATHKLAVDIDLESLKNYLRFHAQKEGAALVFLRQDPSCEKCIEAGPAIRKLVKARLENRGLRPVWLATADVGGAGEGEVTGKGLDERVGALASARNAAAALVIQAYPTPAEDIDAVHADEKRYLIHTFLTIRGLAAPDSNQPAQNEAQMELIDGDHFEVFAARLLTEAFTDMGGRAAKLAVAPALPAGEKSELTIEVTGIHEFGLLTKLKALLQAKFPTASFEERRISREHAVFAVAGEASLDRLKAELAPLDLQVEVYP